MFVWWRMKWKWIEKCSNGSEFHFTGVWLKIPYKWSVGAMVKKFHCKSTSLQLFSLHKREVKTPGKYHNSDSVLQLHILNPLSLQGVWQRRSSLLSPGTTLAGDLVRRRLKMSTMVHLCGNCITTMDNTHLICGLVFTRNHSQSRGGAVCLDVRKKKKNETLAHAHA